MTLADSQFEAARVYHDFNSLAQLKTQGRDDSPEAIREAAKQFESIFTKMMLQSMRDANAAIVDEPLFDSPSLDMYRQMHDEQLSLHLSSSGSGLGLTDILVQQLTSNPASNVYTKDIKTNFEPTLVSKAQSYMAAAESNIEVNRKSSEPAADIDEPLVAVAAIEKVAIDKPTSNSESRGPDFSTPVAFVHSLWRYAEQAAKQLQVDPKVLMAQAALETGWGKHVMRTEQGNSSNNLFGIKANNAWDGEKTQVASLELENGTLNKQRSEFRVYNNHADSFNDYTQFISNETRYQKARTAAAEPETYLQELQSAGYATDPEYADKIGRIYHSPLLNDAIRTLVDGD